jgi:hypothetical protein
MMVEAMEFNNPSKVWHRGGGTEELTTDLTILDKISILAVISVFYPPKSQQKTKTKQRMELSIYDYEGNMLGIKIETGKEKTKVKLKGWGLNEIFYFLKEE